MATSRIADMVGRVLGDRYRVTRPLGTGASAHVYVAEDVRLRRRVAVKVLHPALAGDEAFLRRFRAEARIVASLRHPNVLEVYDWGEDGGAPYLVMALLEGGSLRSLLDAGHLLSPAQAIQVGAQAARALEYAHRRSLVHRDIKPANLIFDDEGRVTVADFGLARALAEATWTEPAGAVVGTARYAAPEQVRGEALDSKADVYALALVLIEATTGSVPFATDTTIGTLMARLGQPITAPATLGPLGRVLERAGTIAAVDRLDASGLAGELDRLRGTYPPPAALPLIGPLVTGLPEHDDHDPTELPRSRPLLFDGQAADLPAAGGYGTGGPGEMAVVSDSAAWAVSSPEADDRPAPAGGPDGGFGRGGAPDRRGGEAAQDRPVRPASPHRRSAADQPEPAAGPDTRNGSGVTEPRAAAEGVARGRGVADRPGVTDPRGAAEGTAPVAHRRRRRRVAAFVGVLVVVLAAAGAVVLVSRPRPYRTVPTLLRETPAAARAALRPTHLNLVVAPAGRFDADVPNGAILAQTPADGTRLREGRSVTVTLSLGPRPVPVPTGLVGQQAAAAVAKLAAVGLRAGPETSTSSLTVPAGAVISVQPASGTLLPGQSVALVVSTGKPTVAVPVLTGPSALSFAAAQTTLQQAELGATEDDVFSNTVAAGHVVGTVPASGASVPVDTVVSVQISKGPELVAVPNVSGLSVGAAASALGADGFAVSGVSGNPNATVTGTVPAEGTLARVGASIQIVTG